jgi:hypothetical protein
VSVTSKARHCMLAKKKSDLEYGFMHACIGIRGGGFFR